MAGSEQIWNLPNALTMMRMAVVPLMLAMPFMLSPGASPFLAWLYIAAATTDVIDGWLARRGQQVTEVGKLLDPLADKMLVSTTLIMLVAVGCATGADSNELTKDTAAAAGTGGSSSSSSSAGGSTSSASGSGGSGGSGASSSSNNQGWTSGSRLRARLLTGSDGSEQFAGWSV